MSAGANSLVLALAVFSDTAAAKTVEVVFKLRPSGIFPIDNQAISVYYNKLGFISIVLQVKRQFNNSYEGSTGKARPIEVHSSSKLPFIRVLRSCKFADAFSPDYFPKTFPTCFPCG